jgi:hypothetical protein
MGSRLKLAAVVAAVGVFGVIAVAVASRGSDEVREELTGYEEVPAVSTAGEGEFRAKIDRRDEEIDWKLEYEDLEGAVAQAHIHLGQEAVNGDITVFLCTNLGNGPEGTQECPEAPATVRGTITPEDVLANDQGIAAGEFDELVDAIKAEVTYANVHSDLFPGGEIRAQLEVSRDGHRD